MAIRKGTNPNRRRSPYRKIHEHRRKGPRRNAEKWMHTYKDKLREETAAYIESLINKAEAKHVGAHSKEETLNKGGTHRPITGRMPIKEDTLNRWEIPKRNTRKTPNKRETPIEGGLPGATGQ